MDTAGHHPAWHLATWTNHRDFYRPDGRARWCVIKTALGKLTRSAAKLVLVKPRENTKGSPKDVNDH